MNIAELCNLSCEAFNSHLKKKTNIRISDIKRIARKAGIIRLSRGAIYVSCQILTSFLKLIVKKAICIARRKTITKMDIIYCLKLMI